MTTEPGATPTVDLNSDLGEGFGRWTLGDDEAMLDLVTSANIACGFHAGDPTTLRRCCAGAVRRGVAIGAQVGYRDLAGFGRRSMVVPPDELADEIVYQLGALDGIARVCGGRVAYVKPHGALYNDAASSVEVAGAVVAAVRAYDPGLPLLGLAGSELLTVAADAGLTTVAEAFADRAYTPEGLLVPRTRPGAVLHDAAAVADRVVRLVTQGVVEAVDGSSVAVAADSVCVHGDTEGAVEVARAVRAALDAAGVTVRPFVAAVAEGGA